MMDIEQNSFLGLNAVATFIWDRLASAHSAEEIAAAVLCEFEADDPEAVKAEVASFLDTLLADKMVTRVDG